jgi:hypothetical protein
MIIGRPTENGESQLKKILSTIILFVIFCVFAQAQDGFEAVQCNSDIPNALIGKHMPNDRVVVLEDRHKAIGLKDLGASEVSDHLTIISWLICGKEYLLLEDDHNIVRDILQFPAHTKSSPEFIGTCKIYNQDATETMVAILDNHAGYATEYALQDKSLFTALAAWKIDEKSAKFLKMSTTGLRCPRNGIITADGGP